LRLYAVIFLSLISLYLLKFKHVSLLNTKPLGNLTRPHGFLPSILFVKLQLLQTILQPIDKSDFLLLEENKSKAVTELTFAISASTYLP
jgi:hypothetical protein